MTDRVVRTIPKREGMVVGPSSTTGPALLARKNADCLGTCPDPTRCTCPYPKEARIGSYMRTWVHPNMPQND